MCPSWSHLLPELLRLLLSAVDPADFHSAAAVCSSWRAAAASSGGPRRLSAPYLLSFAPPGSARPSWTHADVRDLSLLRPASLSLPLSPQIRRFLRSSSSGWIVAVDDVSNLHILNPFTRARCALPPVSSLSGIVAVLGSDGQVFEYGDQMSEDQECCLYYSPDVLSYNLYKKAVLSCNPSSSSDCNACIVALMFRDGRHFASVKPGGVWKTFHGQWEVEYMDGVFIDDLFYIVTKQGCVQVWDPSEPQGDLEPQIVCRDMPDELLISLPTHVYLVKAPWGDLLQVWAHFQRDERNTEFRVYWVNMYTHEHEEMVTLGENAIFVSSTVSACISTNGIPGLKSDCIYFLNDANKSGVSPLKIHVYDYGNNSIDCLLVSDLCAKWPFPTWIVP